MMKKDRKKNSAVKCRKYDEMEVPSMPPGCQNSAQLVPSNLHDNKFSLFEDYNEYVIICFYDVKTTDWINNNFEEQFKSTW